MLLDPQFVHKRFFLLCEVMIKLLSSKKCYTSQEMVKRYSLLVSVGLTAFKLLKSSMPLGMGNVNLFLVRQIQPQKRGKEKEKYSQILRWQLKRSHKIKDTYPSLRKPSCLMHTLHTMKDRGLLRKVLILSHLLEGFLDVL